MFTGRAVSDLHLTEHSAKYVWRVLSEIREDAENRGGVTVLVGDILDQASMVHMPTYNRLRTILHDFPGKVYVVVGNHDQYRAPENALEALTGSNCVVVSKPRWTEIGLMMPYHDKSDFWDAVKAMGNVKHTSTLPIWWTHQGWHGAYLNSMVKDRDGLAPSRIEADLVISGHYHCPQNIGPIIYCGSPYQTTFAEEGQQKGWLMFEEGEAYPSRIAYENVDAPNHVTVHWDPETGPPEVPSRYKEGDRIRVKTQATKADVKRQQSQLDAAGLSGVTVHAMPNVSERDVIDRNVGPIEAVQQYIDRVYREKDDGVDSVSLSAWAKENDLWV